MVQPRAPPFPQAISARVRDAVVYPVPTAMLLSHSRRRLDAALEHPPVRYRYPSRASVVDPGHRRVAIQPGIIAQRDAGLRPHPLLLEALAFRLLLVRPHLLSFPCLEELLVVLLWRQNGPSHNLLFLLPRPKRRNALSPYQVSLLNMLLVH